MDKKFDDFIKYCIEHNIAEIPEENTYKLTFTPRQARAIDTMYPGILSKEMVEEIDMFNKDKLEVIVIVNV